MRQRNAISTLRRRASRMDDFDRLPPELRGWLHHAALPWSARSVRRLWQRALRHTQGDRRAALAALSRAEARALARDAGRIWGASHPVAEPAPQRRMKASRNPSACAAISASWAMT